MTDQERKSDAAPLSAPLIAGIMPQENSANRAFRRDGTDDWLLVATCAGQGQVRGRGGQEWPLARGDLMLIRPSTIHDYGHAGDRLGWRNIWVHFRPRPTWLDWLSWPEVESGISLLATGEDFAAIEAEFLRIVETVHGPSRLRVDAAMNALERVLILADYFNPRFAAYEMDERIHRALVLIGERLSERLDIGELSREVGLSRSQFTALFTRQVQLSPQVYIEKERLNRAAQMLRSSNWSVSQVAAANGFSSPFYFSSRFSREFRSAPSAYRRAHLKRPEGAAELPRSPSPDTSPDTSRKAKS